MKYALLNTRSFWLGVQYLLSVLFSFLTLKLNLYRFGGEVMGLWFTLTAVWAAFFVFDFGLATGSVISVAELNARGAARQLGSVCTTVLAAGSLLGVAYFTVAAVVTAAIFGAGRYSVIVPRSTILEISVLFGGSALLQFLAQNLKSIIEGLGEYVRLSRVMILSNMIATTLVAGVAMFRLSIVALAVASLVAAALSLALLVRLFTRVNRGIAIDLRSVSFIELRRLVRIGGVYQLSTVCNALIDPIIKFAIGRSFHIADVALFEIARRFSVAVEGLFSSSFRYLLPAIAAIADDQSFERFIAHNIRPIARFGTGYAAFTLGMCALPIFGLMHFWFKNDRSFLLYLIIIAPTAVNILFYPYYIALLGRKRTSVLAIMQVCNLVLISAAVIAGYSLVRSHLVLYGYLVSVIAVDSGMFEYYRRALHINLVRAAGFQAIGKTSLMLVLLMIGSVLSMAGRYFDAAIFVTALSVLIFYPDIRHAFRLAISHVATRQRDSAL